ncbi:MAG TPA: ComF family protein [Armatimonadota bacterium]|nr:ComF family protein [Armatimonadota bacterium]
MAGLRDLGAGFVDLLYPPRCLTCGALAEPFCGGCRSQIEPVEADRELPHGIHAARSAGWHEGPLRTAVLRLKFERKTALARPLGLLLAEQLESAPWKPDALVPVPIHWLRRLERGFNQSELIAEQLSRASGVPVHRLLRRTRYTLPQVGQSRSHRAENLRGAFALGGRDALRGARLALVDDVRTTGATLLECTAVLRAAGASRVYALTVTHDR